jgi:hypothetical protein
MARHVVSFAGYLHLGLRTVPWYHCLLLDTPYRIYTVAAAADINGIWRRKHVTRSEYMRIVLCVSWMLVGESRFDWMALPRT